MDIREPCAIARGFNGEVTSGASYDFEYIVLGAGAMGSAAAYQLGRQGKSVLLLEQFEIAHERGASHGHSRIIRYSYDHPLYVRLAKHAYRAWRELEVESGEKLIWTTGGLDLGDLGDGQFKACVDSLTSEGIAFERLDHKALARQYPQIAATAQMEALYQSDAGILDATFCVNTMVREARRHSVVVKDNCPVTGVQILDRGVKVETGSGTFSAGKLIVCAGAWSSKILSQCGLQLPFKITREQVSFYKPEAPELFSAEKFPIFIYYGGVGSGGIGWYGFPCFGLPGVKAAVHEGGPVIDIDQRNFDVDPDMVAQVGNLVHRLFPDVTTEAIHTTTCLYTITPDHHFVIDLLPGAPHVAIGAGFSGHGFKFAPVIGAMLADLVSKGRTDYPHDLFGLSRLLQDAT